MRTLVSACGCLTLIALSLFVGAAPASAWSKSGTSTISFGPNLGTLTYGYYYSGVTGGCYVDETYSGFVYNNSAAGISQAISGSTFQDVDTCNSANTAYGPTITYNGNGYTITIPGGFKTPATISVPGYINLKYIILGVLYAPPGHQSNVDYTNSDLVSSTVTTKNSLSSSYTQSKTLQFSTMIHPWKNGEIDSGVQVSSSFTQATTTTDSTAVTVQKTTGTSIQAAGPVCDYCGVDHDYDLVAVWLNPVQLFTLTNGGTVTPNGYGFSSYDQPGMDVYYVYVGELNGDFQLRNSTTTAFGRSWASSFLYMPGDGPALTAQDEQNILKADPYWNCTYKSPVSDTTDCAEPPDSTRFTQSTNTSFPYQQPIPGGQPITKGYSWSYTTTNTTGIDASYSFSQTFALETTFGASIFSFGFQEALKQEWTTSSTYETSSEFTSSNTSTAAASITGPLCNVANGSCNPVYPPSNAYTPVSCTPLQLATAFGQGDNMFLYQDNLFGTFMVEPYGQ